MNYTDSSSELQNIYAGNSNVSLCSMPAWLECGALQDCLKCTDAYSFWLKANYTGNNRRYKQLTADLEICFTEDAGQTLENFRRKAYFFQIG